MKTRLKRIATGMIALSLVLTGMTGCGQHTDQQPSSGADTNGAYTVVRYGVMPSGITQWIGIIDAKKDIFKNHGIQLEPTEFAMGINTVDAIVTDQLDIGNFADYAGVNRIGNTADETNLRIFTETNRSQIGDGVSANLYVSPDVNSVEDLKGKHVATIGGSVYDYWYGKLFEAYDLGEEDVSIDSVTSSAEALALANGGSISAFWANGADAVKLTDEYGWQALDLGEFSLPAYSYLVSTDTWLKDHHETAVEFLKACQETLDYMAANEEEVVGWIAEATGQDEKLVKANIASWNFDFTFSQEAYESLVDVSKWCYENGNYEKEYNIADFISIDAVKEAFPDKVTYTK